MLHQSGPQARTELTRRTGLNRSTIGGIIADLAAVGLVEESWTTGSEPRGVGRPSPTAATTGRAVAIALNPELDAVSAAAVTLGGVVLQRTRRELASPVTVDEALEISAELVADLIAGMSADAVLVGIGVAVPGLVSGVDGIVRNAPHLGWSESTFAADLAELTGIPTSIANDAAVGARAERIFGAGRGVDDLVYLNGGASGIGGGVLSEGRAVRGVDGYAGEFGHMLVPTVDGAARLEDVVERSALLSALDLTSADERTLHRRLVEDATDEVRAEVERQARVLAVAIANVITTLNPRLVVLGGFLASLLATAPETVRAQVAASALREPMATAEVVPAELGPDLLFIGAAELAFEAVLSDPLATMERDSSSSSRPSGRP
ncbi:transcriptional regulator [Amnibacterium flavum]|uniref:Transcriptional regulator n=2 Tax=Amnibacterium flavum TaxID=2173173 RepID=A0A2V1HWQ1_9MICO|nr:transcriptional regulator [Amnibacterium flavum]